MSTRSQRHIIKDGSMINHWSQLPDRPTGQTKPLTKIY